MKGLNYELWVYSHVIRVLVDQRVCPNFSRYLGHGKRCTLENLTNFSNPSFEASEITKTIQKMKDKNLIFDEKANAEYRMLVTEFAHGPTVENYLASAEFGYTVWEILLQIAIACYALFLSKTMHNDLHSANIILVRNEAPITYIIDSETYTINPGFTPKVFDFDQAFTKRYKENPVLKRHDTATMVSYDFCNNLGRCNEFVGGYDIFTIFVYFYRKFPRPEIISVLSATARPINFTEERRPDKYNPNWYNANIFKLPKIIENIAKKLVLMDIQADVVYDCSERRFTPDGRLKKTFDEHEKLSRQVDDMQRKNDRLRTIQALEPQEIETMTEKLLAQHRACGLERDKLQLDNKTRNSANQIQEKTQVTSVNSKARWLERTNEILTELLTKLSALGITVALSGALEKAIKSKFSGRGPPRNPDVLEPSGTEVRRVTEQSTKHKAKRSTERSTERRTRQSNR